MSEIRNRTKISIADPDPYRFQKTWQRKVAKYIDLFGGVLFGTSSFEICWEKVRRIAIIRLDGLGDLLLATPFLESLKMAAPNAKLDLLVGPWAFEVARSMKNTDGVKVLDGTPWKKPHSRPWSWTAILKLGKMLREEKYDAVIDLRGDIRHLIGMKISKTPIRIGQILTGGKFLLTHPVKYDPALHVIEQNLFLLSQVSSLKKIKDICFSPLECRREDVEKVEHLKKELGIENNIIVIHPTAVAQSKEWPGKNWIRLIEKIDRKYNVLFVGGEGDKTRLEYLKEKIARKTFVSAGVLSIPQLYLLLKDAVLFIGLDSSPGHVAAMAGTQCISLFSGNGLVHQWRAFGPNITVLHKVTECTPCGLNECPFDNDCMRQITVEEVLEKTLELLQRMECDPKTGERLSQV